MCPPFRVNNARPHGIDPNPILQRSHAFNGTISSPLADLHDSSIQQTSQTRTRLAVAEKATMVSSLLQGAQIAHIVQEYNCSERTTYNIKSKAEKYIVLAASGSTASKKARKHRNTATLKVVFFHLSGLQEQRGCH